MAEIKNVAVIGAGTMGSGIAAVFANAGYEVVLLDNRDAAAVDAVKKMQQGEKPILKEGADKKIACGNMKDIDLIEKSDLIVEVVFEKLDVKHDVFKLIDQKRKPGSIVASNTSGILLEKLTEGMSDKLKNDMLITHFFNPPHIMKLVEVIPGKETRPAAVETAKEILTALGKEVVNGKDTPGFIANRIGTFARMKGVTLAIETGASIEEADAVVKAITGAPVGPFALTDIVKLSRWNDMLTGMKNGLPKSDEFHTISMPKDLEKMNPDDAAKTMNFYKKDEDGRKVIDPKTLLYTATSTEKPAAVQAMETGGLAALANHNSAAGRFARAWLKEVTGYVNKVSPEIADSPAEIDIAMKAGYAWKNSPSQIQEKLPEYFYKHISVNIDAEGVAKVVIDKPKVNAMNVELMHEIQNVFTQLDKDPKVKVATLEGAGKVFSGGADMNWMKAMVDYNLEDNIKDCRNFTNMFEAVYNFSKPLIGKVHGAAMGGGIGLATLCDYTIAEEGTKFAYTEVRLGIYPAMISPYSIPKIGEENANVLFKSGREFSATEAKDCGLIDKTASREEIDGAVASAVKLALSTGKTRLRQLSDSDRKATRINLEAGELNIDPEVNEKMNELIKGVLKMHEEGKSTGDMADFTIPFTAEARITPRAQEKLRGALEAMSKAVRQ